MTETEEQQRAKRRWGELVVDFTQETTLHGIRFITGETRYLSRRIAWILALIIAAVIFLYFVSTKLIFYFQYEKAVNVEVQYKGEMDFPVVTLCNLNQFRMSGLQQYGLIDALTVLNSGPYRHGGKEVIRPINGDVYNYLNSTCSLPNNKGIKWQTQLKDTTRELCSSVCSTLYSDKCASILHTPKACTLSSYRGDLVQQCDPKGQAEYYIRKRNYEYEEAEFICTFESGKLYSEKCRFIMETPTVKGDEWSVVSGNNRIPAKDVTLESAVGHYLLLPNTYRKPGYSVSYTSPFIQAVDTCISLYYNFLGKGAQLKIYLRQTDLFEKEFVYITGNESSLPEAFMGKRLFRQLPKGEYQVRIEAKRNFPPSGVVIDNLMIRNCTNIDTSCMHGPTGLDYTGTLSQTKSGKTCVPWTEVSSDRITETIDSEQFPDLTVKDAKNYCRNIQSSTKQRPFCFYRTNQGILAKEECDITFCDCLEADMFRCTSGLCIPQSLTCNGVDNCGDGSDEGQICSHLNNINCAFEHEYMCGYTSNTLLAIHWQRHQNDLAAIYGNPVVDSAGLTTGFYMFIDNRLATSGDIAVLNTPNITLYGYTEIEFYVHIYIPFSGDMSSLNVYLSEADTKKQLLHLLEIRETKSSAVPWKLIRIPCVQTMPGSYILTFSAAIGTEYSTRIGIDNVTVHTGLSSCNYGNNGQLIVYNETTTWQNCTFNGTKQCPFKVRTGNVYLDTGVMFEGDFNDAMDNFIIRPFQIQTLCPKDSAGLQNCSIAIYETEGSILSPNFPGNYPSSTYIKYTFYTHGYTKVSFDVHFLETECGQSCTFDYIQISYKDAGFIRSTHKLCCQPDRNNSIIEDEGDEVYMEFRSDSTTEQRGYSIYYQIQRVPNNKYILGFANRMQRINTDVSRPISLESPLIAGNVDRCLTFSYYVLDYLEVLRTEAITGTQTVLWKLSKSPGDLWQETDVNLPKTNHSYIISFVLRMKQSAQKQGYVVFLDNIGLTTGKCKLTDIVSYNCSFDEGVCGYEDKSGADSESSWIHALKASVSTKIITDKDDMVMRAVFVDFSCRMVSPTVNIQGEKCLTFDYLCVPSGGRKMVLILVSTINSVQGKVNIESGGCGNLTEMLVHDITLPSGLYKVEFIASNSDTFALDNIQFTDGACSAQGAQVFNETDPEQDIPSATNQVDMTADRIKYEPHTVVFHDITDSYHLSTELGNLSVMTKSLSEESTSSMMLSAAHQHMDMILSCTWNNADCTADDFTPVFTEIGLCYSFNNNKTQPTKVTTQTGSGSGLKVLLNVEDYEYLEGEANYAGVKVFLHEPHEIPYVKFLGVAAPTSMNSLIQIQPVQSIKLKQPYGNCTDTPDQFYANEKYTRFKCQRGCHTKDVIEKCGCTNPYMPGNTSECSVAKFIECAYPKGMLSMSTTYQCDCREACKEMVYNAQVSYSRLSQQNVDLYLDTDRNQISGNFETALEQRLRLSRGKFELLASTLDNVAIYHRQFMDYLTNSIFGTETSVIAIIETAADKMMQLAYSEINTTMEDLPKMITLYNGKVSQFWDSIHNSIINLINFMNNYHSMISQLQTPTNQFTIQAIWARYLEDNLIGMIPNVVQNLDMYAAFAAFFEPIRQQNRNFIPGVYILNKKEELKCTDNAKSFTFQLNDLLSSINTLSASTIVSNNASPSPSEDTLITDMLLKIKQIEEVDLVPWLEPCLMEYKRFLDSTINWFQGLKTSPLSSVYSKAIDKDKTMLPITIDSAYLQNTIQSYLSHKISQLELCNILVTKKALSDTSMSIDNIYNDINTLVIQELLVALDSKGKTLKDWYKQAMNKSIHLGSYLLDAQKYEGLVKLYHVWQKPVVDTDISQIIKHAYTDDDISKSWPKDKTLVQFYNSTADFVLSTRIDDVFTALKNEITNAAGQMKTLKASFNEESADLMQLLEQLKADNLIDGAFVLENFVQLNVFYGELKYDYIEQTPAYDIPTFFSELGGYMGLLLGASVMTICELCDLIVYNFLIKLNNKKKVNKSDHVSDMPPKAV